MRLFCWFWFWFSSLGHNNFHPYGFNGCPSISFSLFPFIAYFLRCWCSIAKSCPTLCNCMDHSTPGSSVLHYLPELARIHVHWVPCYLSISSSVTPFTFCLQSFPASGSFPMSQLFAWGGQSNEASASVCPMNIQGWFPLGLTGLISLLSKRLSRVFSSTTVWKHQFFGANS